MGVAAEEKENTMTDSIDYGEPWKDPDLGIVLKASKKLEGSEVVVAEFSDHDDGARAAACVNALKGCPDPKEFVDVVKIVFSRLRLMQHGRYENGDKIRPDMMESFASHILAEAEKASNWLKEEKA